METLIPLFATSQMQYIVILLMVDVVLGIIGAIISKDFVFRKVANFMKGPVLGYVLGFAVIEMVGQALPSLALLVPTALVLIIIALLGSIIGNLGRFGLPLPKILKK